MAALIVNGVTILLKAGNYIRTLSLTPIWVQLIGISPTPDLEPRLPIGPYLDGFVQFIAEIQSPPIP